MFSPELILWLQSFSTPWLDRIMILASALGSEYGYMALLPFLYWMVDRRRGAELGYLLLASMWLNGFLKEAFNLPRPSPAEGVRRLVQEHSNGFPSGHAQGAMTVFGYLYAEYKHRRLRWAAVILIVLIAGSRPYLGVHYPGDTLGGLAVGLVLVWLFRTGYARGWGDRLPRRWKTAMALTVPWLLLPLYQASVAYQTLGFFTGLAASDPYAREAVPLQPRVGIAAQAARVAIGYTGFAVLYLLHSRLIPDGILELPGYALIGVWVTTGAPYLYWRLGLAGAAGAIGPVRIDLIRSIALWSLAALILIAAGAAALSAYATPAPR